MYNSFKGERSSGRSGGSNFRSGGARRSFGGSRGSSRGGFGGGSGGFGRRSSSGRKRFQGTPISINKFINKTPTDQVIAEYTPTHTFADFGFHQHIVDNLTKKGYVHPTRIQDESIPHTMEGKDVIGLANTGSGKTAAFVLPILHKIKMSQSKTDMVLIITPTRELASQIDDEFKKFSEGMRIYTTLCVGGINIRPQMRQLSRNPHVVIGTPGRLKDLMNQGALKLDTTTTLVLDEADRMLDMGFLKDIEYIINKIPTEAQKLCFSATITREIAALLDKMLKDPVTISVRTSETGEHIAQDVIKVRHSDEKLEKLVEMLNEPHFEKVLIFGEMKFSVQKLADTLCKSGLPAEAIHGNKSQPQRQRALDSFKCGKVNILVATDVAARGLDIPNVSHVINFDQPQTHADYVHRIGRTGRAGKPGQAYTFIS